MVESKIRLSLRVPGAKMLSSQVCEKNTKRNYNISKMNIEYSEGKKKKKETLTIQTRKQELVSQSISINKEAYDYMLDTSTSPKFLKKVKKGGREATVWSLMTIDERLKHHFNQIAHDLNAVSYSYVILED